MVTVKLADGTERTFREADSVAPAEMFIRVDRWNTKTRRLDEVAVFGADQVVVAEVSKNGIVSNGVYGLAASSVKNKSARLAAHERLALTLGRPDDLEGERNR
jgi:hypothetical protein